VLVDAHVFDDLSTADANRVAEIVAFEVIRCDWALDAAAADLDDRGNQVLTDRQGGWDDRMMSGLSLHRAARLLEAG
jgi:hypothetical protein